MVYECSGSPLGARRAEPEQSHGTADAAELICSAKGCRRPAGWVLLWNNPRLHDPDRRKRWLACDEHRETLGDFLRARGFLRDVEPLP